MLFRLIRTNPVDFDISDGRKLLINTINANTFNLVNSEKEFLNSIIRSDILLPDGVGALIANRFLTGRRIRKISGYDLFIHEMSMLKRLNGRCFFIGSTERVLELIRSRVSEEYPGVSIGTYSPPYKENLSDSENRTMISAVNAFRPDVLFVGMTQPKQEKWAARNIDQLDAMHICCIGAVFDFYAGTVKRAPQWMINIGLEWFYRLIREPKRLWKRYLIGNSKFLIWLFKEKFFVTA
jgi:N-acetylglucosaminyldiphosphoundecaprenol N-acetyl-beta-D-mannosaminyltransferase